MGEERGSTAFGVRTLENRTLMGVPDASVFCICRTFGLPPLFRRRKTCGLCFVKRIHIMNSGVPQHSPHTGRILMAAGCDATDTGPTTASGWARLIRVDVHPQELSKLSPRTYRVTPPSCRTMAAWKLSASLENLTFPARPHVFFGGLTRSGLGRQNIPYSQESDVGLAGAKMIENFI